MSDTAITILILLMGLVFYFLPWIVAVNREHDKKLGVFILNLFLGWILLGWVAALVWAVSGPRPVGLTGFGERTIDPEMFDRPAGYCSSCGAPSKAGARFCSSCGTQLGR